MYSSNHDENTIIRKGRKEQQCNSQLKGSKLKITKKQNKYQLTIINVYAL